MKIKKIIMLIFIVIVSLSLAGVVYGASPKVTFGDVSTGAVNEAVIPMTIEIDLSDYRLSPLLDEYLKSHSDYSDEYIQEGRKVFALQEGSHGSIVIQQYEIGNTEEDVDYAIMRFGIRVTDSQNNDSMLDGYDSIKIVEEDGKKKLVIEGSFDTFQQDLMPENVVIDYKGYPVEQYHGDYLDSQLTEIKSSDVIKISKETQEQIDEIEEFEEPTPEQYEEQGNIYKYYIQATPNQPFVVQYKELPFYFAINKDNGGLEGTYVVSFDPKAKTVSFLFLGGDKRVGYLNEHGTTLNSFQVGTTPVNLAKRGITSETTPLYIIKEVLPYGVQDNLKNGFISSLGSASTSYKQAENVYVFVNERGNYNSLHEEVSVFYQFVGLEEADQEAGWLEKLLTRITEALGDAFLWVIRFFLGSDVTIDSIIFNEYDPVVIDFEGGRGWFAAVLPTLEPVYIALRNIAAGIYLVALLYIGVTILLSVGNNFRQRQYAQHLTSWLIGLALLFIVPQFFKYIVSATNAIVGEMKGQVTKQYTYYNIDDEKLKKWGFTDEEILKLRGTSGEDTRTVWVETLIGRRDALQEKIPELTKKEEESQGSMEQALDQAKQDWESHHSGVTLNFDNMVSSMQGYVDSLVDSGEEITEQKIQDTFRSTPYAPYVNIIYNLAIAHSETKSLQNIIAELNTFIAALQYDLMGQMRALSGETDRLVYAVVWLICIFEMIIILCLYYRRVIVMLILILIYPLVAATYPFDKMGDGKSQSVSLWFKEFIVNITVQIAHAIVYVVLVEAGKRLFMANSNNWLFFLLAVLFLFPAERIMRSIFGMQASSIGNLKASVGGTIAGTAMAVSVGKNIARSANQNIGITKGGKKQKEENKKKADKERANRDKRDAYLQGRADQKERIRNKKRVARNARMMYANRLQRAGYQMMNIASQIRSGAYRVGNAGRSLKGQYRKLQDSRAMRYAGKAYRMARGAAGIAYGAAEFVKGAGRREGLGASFSNSVAKGRLVGGFKEYSPTAYASKGVSVGGSGSSSSSGSTSSSSASSSTPSGSGSSTTRPIGGSSAGGTMRGSSGSSSGTTRTTTRTSTSYTGPSSPSGGGTSS